MPRWPRTSLRNGLRHRCVELPHLACEHLAKTRVRDPCLYFRQTKIAIKVPDEQQLQSVAEAAKAMGIAARVIQDAYVTRYLPSGRTQVEPGSRTVVGIGPAPISLVDQLTRQFKLL